MANATGALCCTACNLSKSKWILRGHDTLPSGEKVPYQFCSVACLRDARKKELKEGVLNG